MTRVAIMQPTYLPWCGYFALMQSVDLFIFFDSVQFARRSWQQRNQIKTAKGAQWLTVPVVTKGKRDQTIAEVEIDSSAHFASAHRKSIELNYSRAPFFDALAPDVLSLIEKPRELLAELNIDLILQMKEMLGIATPVAQSSELSGAGVKADLLASLCSNVGASEYVSPPGSRDYIEQSDAFDKIGVPVRYLQFAHPEYPQLFDGFLPYMSTIDMLFNYGHQSLSLIETGCEVIS